MKKYTILTLCAVALMALAFSYQSKPTLYLIGDSTTHNNDKDMWGWGSMIGQYLDLDKINLVNAATAGRSTRTFVKEGRWDKVYNNLKPGDYVMMVFGHNEGAKPDTSKNGYRGVFKGTGEDTVALHWKDGSVEVVHSYGWYLRKFVRDTKAKGATPIILSMIPRREWDKDGKIVRANKDYGLWAKQIADQEGVAFIDMNEITAAKYDQMPHDTVYAMFPHEHTHTNKKGADINAQSVVTGIKAQPGLSLNQYLK